MSKAKSRLTAVTWGQIQETARQCAVQGLPANGDRVKCFKRKLPIRGRQICFMALVRGPVRGTVVVLAAVAAPSKSLERIEFGKKDAPRLFIDAAETAAKLKRLEEEELEGGARQYAGQSSAHPEPAPFAAKAMSAKPRPNRRSSRVQFRGDRARVMR